MTTPDSPTGLAGRYVQAMNQVATAVSIITAHDPADRAALGQTASAVTTVAGDPPVLLLCINGRSALMPAIRASGRFRVNYLAVGHDRVADTFAGHPGDGTAPYDFTGGQWRTDAPAGPQLLDALASFECDVADVKEIGHQVVLLGSVTEVVDSPAADPLLYLNGIYRRVEELPLSVFPVFPRLP